MYVIGIIDGNSEDELNLPETWYMDWDEPIEKKEFYMKHYVEHTSKRYEEELRHDQDNSE